MSAQNRDNDKTVFVGNLSYQTSTDSFKQAFEQFGVIESARVITYRFRGQTRSRGFGFITFNTVEETQKAVAAQSFELDGRKVRIVISKPQQRKPRLTAFLGGVVAETTEEMIREKFPTAKEVNIHPPMEQRRGFAFVKFESEEALTAAIKEVRELDLNGAKVVVRFAKPQRRPFRRYRRGGYRHAAKPEAPKQE